MKLAMTGLDHKRASLDIREKFALPKEKAKKILALVKDNRMIAGCVIISTCNRTELYVSVTDNSEFFLSKTLCAAIGMNGAEYESCLTERTDGHVMEHLCRVASGLDSQIMGDDQIITQVREALELSREQNSTDNFLETMFRLSIQAAKIIKTNIFSGALGASSVPEKTIEKMKMLCSLSGKNALVIGNGKIGRLIAELLIRENVRVTITLRSHKRNNEEAGGFQIPDKAHTINYDERYRALENADIVISATTSPHLTLLYNEVSALKQGKKIIFDLAVPRDVEPSIKSLPGVTLLTIDDISGEARRLPPESVLMIENIIAEHLAKYHQWQNWRPSFFSTPAKGRSRQRRR